MARVLFFGRLRDAAGCSEREVELEHAIALSAFRRLAASGDREFEAALSAPSVRVAINAELTSLGAACSVSPTDEVGFMPPFSGG
jgi:molybdopterin synthase sulfur carrier subunit